MLALIGKAVATGVLAATMPLAAHAGTQDFAVYAKDHSVAFDTHDAAPLNTGITLSVGSTLDITATGLWNGGAFGDFDANGTVFFGVNTVTGINFYSLIGKIGSSDDFDNTWFKIGTSYSGVAASAGTLYLAFLDSDSLNNSGFVTASVTAVPEPGTWAMMVFGVAGVAALCRRRAVAQV